MSEEFKKLIFDRWSEIPVEVQAYMTKDDFPRKMDLVSKKYHLDSEQDRYFKNNVIFVLLTLDSLDNLYNHFIEDLNLSPLNAEKLATDTREYICGGVSSYLAHKESDLIAKDDEPPVSQTVKISSTEVQPTQPAQPAQPTPEQNPTKASLLSAIENPQRTVIKRYVIEHEPITDPEHIIDDTIDTRLRLES